MSRFSLAEAQSNGWVIVHNNPKEVDDKPASIVAEKHIVAPSGADVLVHEEAATMGLLLERVFAFDAHLAKIPEPEVDVEAQAREDGYKPLPDLPPVLPPEPDADDNEDVAQTPED